MIVQIRKIKNLRINGILAHDFLGDSSMNGDEGKRMKGHIRLQE